MPSNLRIGIVRFHAGDLHRPGGDPQGVAAAAHAADVADQRHLGHRGGGRDPDHRRGEGATTLSKVLGFIAVTAAMTNIVSGFLITDRMLKMFKKREEKK